MDARRSWTAKVARALRTLAVAVVAMPGSGAALLAWGCSQDAPPEAAERTARVPIVYATPGGGVAPAAAPVEEPAPPVIAAPAAAQAPAAEAAPAPAAPLPPPAPVREASVAAPPAAPPPAPRRVTAPEGLRVEASALAAAVEAREPVGVASRFRVGEAEQVWAWVRVHNPGAPTHLLMVWRQDGRERARVALDVGTSPRWRTWSRKRLAPSAEGAWTVEVLDAEGRLLETLAFEVEGPATAATPGT